MVCNGITMRFLGITSEKNGLHDLEMVVIIGHEKGIYPLVMTFTVCQLENHHAIKNGKPFISMGHLYHGYVSHNQRVLDLFTLGFVNRILPLPVDLDKSHGVPREGRRRRSPRALCFFGME